MLQGGHMTIDALDTEIITSTDSFKEKSPTSAPLSPTEEKTQTVALSMIKEGVAGNPKEASIFNLDPAREMAQGIDRLENKLKKEKINPLQAEAEAIAGTDETPGTIDLLLDLSKELSSLLSEKPQLSDRAKELLQELKEKGIDLLDIDEKKEFTKEQLADLKTRIATQTDVQRTKLQQIFTKIQTELQNLSTLIDTAKKTISEQTDLMRKVLDRSIKR